MGNSKVTKSTDKRPEYVLALEAVFGAPSQEAFGSAVFYEPARTDVDLAELAKAKYRYFVGNLWEKYGEKAWTGPWKQVYARASGAKPDIVAELKGISDPDAANSVPMFLDGIDNPDAARKALSTAFDQPDVADLKVFNIGDGEAMSGILLAGRRVEDGVTFLVFLMD
jgi:hypothetical protein